VAGGRIKDPQRVVEAVGTVLEPAAPKHKETPILQDHAVAGALARGFAAVAALNNVKREAWKETY
jgi:hypothetical protein